MSWDVVIFNLDRKVSSVEEIDDSILVDIGTEQEFRQILSTHFPDIRWKDNCGILDRENVYFEVYADDSDEPCSTNTFFLRGGEASIFEIISLCKKYNWQLFDTALEAMIDLDDPSKNGYNNYRSYVEQISKK